MAKLPSVYKRAGSPVYWGSVMVSGKRKQYALCENKAAAQRMLAEIKAEQKGRSKYGDTPWQAFKNRYFEWNTANNNPKTVYLDKHAFDYFENFHTVKELAEIDLTLLEQFQTWLKNTSTQLAETYKPHKGQKRPLGMMGNDAINRVVRSMKKAFRKAAEWNLMPEIKWERVKKFKTPKGRIEFFNASELGILLSKSEEIALAHNGYAPQKTITLLGACAGLRRGEMVNLEWADLDFKRRKITIQPKKNWHPKDYECRDIDMPEQLYEYLLSLPHKSHKVLYDYYGEPYSLDSVSTRYRNFVHSAGLEGGVHKLRHTFASHLVQNGVDLYTVSKLLGHNSITTTEIYAHLSPLTFAQAIAKLPRF